jgi:hypothetical protein
MLPARVYPMDRPLVRVLVAALVMFCLAFGVASIVLDACTPADAQAVAAATEDPRIRADESAQSACRQAGRDVQLDAGGDASLAVQAAGFAVYCACTVDAGLRASCAGVH